LRPGDPVRTLDAGAPPIKWARRANHPLEDEALENHPVLIQAHALGPGRPMRDLVVSPQHLILVGRCGQLDGLFQNQSLIPAKVFTALPGCVLCRANAQ
jgi:hypothetical protein